jgi:hypothetical protein
MISGAVDYYFRKRAQNYCFQCFGVRKEDESRAVSTVFPIYFTHANQKRSTFLLLPPPSRCLTHSVTGRARATCSSGLQGLALLLRSRSKIDDFPDQLPRRGHCRHQDECSKGHAPINLNKYYRRRVSSLLFYFLRIWTNDIQTGIVYSTT